MPETKTLDLSQFEKPDKDMPNVKKLWSPNVEQKHKDELPFDLEEDITDKDWENIRNVLAKYLHKSRQTEQYKDFLLIAKDIKILKPEFDFGLEKIDWKKIRENLIGSQTIGLIQDKWTNFLELSESIKIINPTIYFSLDKDLYSKNREGIKKFWENHKQKQLRLQSELLDKIKLAVAIKITDPQINLGMNKNFYEAIRNSINMEIGKSDVSFTTILLNELVGLKILNPKTNLDLNKKLIAILKNDLTKYKKLYRENDESWIIKSLVHHISQLQILNAKEINITNRGLELILQNKKPPISKTPPLPTKLNLN